MSDDGENPFRTTGPLPAIGASATIRLVATPAGARASAQVPALGDHAGGASGTGRSSIRRAAQHGRLSRIQRRAIPAPPPVAPYWRQSGTVRTVARWMCIAAFAFATVLTAILLPPPAALADPVSRPALRSAITVEPVPPPTFAQVHGSQPRDPFAFKAAAYAPRQAAPVPVAPAAAPEPPPEPPIEVRGLEVLAILGGASPAASVRDGGKQRMVQVGDELRGAKVTAIAAAGISLARGSRKAEVAVRGGPRPLAMRAFRGGGETTLRTRTAQPKVEAPPPARRKLGVGVRDAQRVAAGQPTVQISAVSRSDVDLKPGDGLVSIDGIAVASSADAMRVLGDRRSAPSVVLAVLRDGATLSVTVPWKD